MKKNFIFFAFTCLSLVAGICFPGSAFDPIIKFHSFDGALNNLSDTLHRKFIHSHLIDIANGEMIYFKSSTKDFAVALCVRNEKGDTLGGVEVPKYYNDKGSYLSYLFKPVSAGKYQFLVTSRDSLEEGRFSASYARFNPDQNPFDDRGEFCDLLNYLIQHSAADFQFIVREQAKEFSLTRTRVTDYYLITPSKCEIEYFTSDVYICTVQERLSLEKCIQNMKELDYEIKKCLTPQWKISEMNRDNVKPMYRERFEKEFDYILPGKAAGDMNEFHRDRNFQYSIRLLIEKDLASGYDLKVILE